ncbi:MAG: type II toxin-antitoxin system Phd/YefM family antitoxin [Methylococcales bacterium]|nr:type II toxin-antitoxin system Phd/YefM family antitoxin [Methylococcales bacterium]
MITANELNTRGIACLEESLKHHSEVAISVEGKERFVVMSIEGYHYLREIELDAALQESKADIAAGRYIKESPEEHLARLESME